MCALQIPQLGRLVAGNTDDWSLLAPHLSLLACLVNPEHRNKSVSLQCSSHHFLGTETLTALLPEGLSMLLFFSGILCLEMEGELKIQRVLFSARFSRNGSVEPRKLLKPETDFPRQLISLPATIPARARCLSKQNLHAQFPDHSSQTTEDDDHIFFWYSIISIYVSRGICRVGLKKSGGGTQPQTTS